jgi:hypothetical protein
MDNFHDQINIENNNFNIKKIILYKINKESYIKNLSYNVNTNTITWMKNGNNNTVTIMHNLNSNVKVVLDREYATNYKLYKVDNNIIKIDFGTLIPKTCILNIFKVG